MRRISLCSVVLGLSLLVAFAPPAFAVSPGKNGRIAYTKLVDPDSTTQRRAIYVDGRQASFPLGREGDTSDSDAYPAYSPDGTQLAFVRHKGDTDDYLFMLAKADGSEPRQLGALSDLDVAQYGSAGRSTASALVWSPNGQSVGFIRKYQTAPFFVDAIYAIDATSGGFFKVADQINGTGSVPGFDWQGGGAPGKVGAIAVPCISAIPHTVFCQIEDLQGSQVAVTTFAPNSQAPENSIVPSWVIPRWEPLPSGEGKPTVMFVMAVPVATVSGTQYLPSVFSIVPAVPNGGQPQGQPLTDLTPDRALITCAGRHAGVDFTTDYPRYNYGNAYPSPDGRFFLLAREEREFKTTRIDDSETQCSIETVSNALYVFDHEEGQQQQVDTDIDTSFGLAWQASPANVTISVTDGHADPLHGVVVQLRDFDNPDAVVYGDPRNSSGGDYQFEGVAPGKYRVRVTLDDIESKAFEVRHGFPADEAVWAERQLVVGTEGNKIDSSFEFNGDAILNSSIQGVPDESRLDAMAAIFYQTHRFVDWVHANLTPDTGAKVTVYTFADNTETSAYLNNNIFIGVADSAYSNRDGAGQAPVNGEWHEFAHHLDDAFIHQGLPCHDTNHGGYANPTTCDSLIEGFAMFLAAYANGSPDYGHFFDMEAQIKAWGSRLSDQWFISTEDEAAATLLWDLVDGSGDAENTQVVGLGGAHLPQAYVDNTSLTLRGLWNLLTSTHPQTIAALRQDLDAGLPLSIDLDYDGVPDVTAFDEPFLMHGFFPIFSDQVIRAGHFTYHYNVEGLRQHDNGTPANDNVGHTGHDAFSLGGITAPAQEQRDNLKPARAAHLSLSAHDAAGRELKSSQVTLTVHYPDFDRTLTQVLPSGAGDLVHLELPNYFDYLLEPGQTTPPPCDPEHDAYVSVTVTATINGYTSNNSYGFDNCSYIQAQLAASGAAALSYDMIFPEDAAPPVTQIATDASGAVAGDYTNGTWTVRMSCSDPVIGGFASGCFTTQYSIDGGPWTNYALPLVLSAPGLHTFAYFSRDAAGNAETAQTVSLGVAGQLDDATAPVTTASTVASIAPDSDNATSGFWTVSLACVDPPGTPGEQVSGCQSSLYSIDGAEFAPYSDPVEIHDVGRHVFQYFSMDVWGNVEQPAKSVVLTIKEVVPLVSVPAVVGLAQSAAVAALTDAGLEAGSVTQQSSSTVPSGVVISQAPGAGTNVTAGSAVNLVVSSGAPSGASFGTLKNATQATKISAAGLKALLLLDISTAEALYLHDREPAAFAAMELYKGLVRAASGHSIAKTDATNLLSLADAVEQEVRAKSRT